MLSDPPELLKSALIFLQMAEKNKKSIVGQSNRPIARHSPVTKTKKQRDRQRYGPTDQRQRYLILALLFFPIWQTSSSNPQPDFRFCGSKTPLKMIVGAKARLVIIFDSRNAIRAKGFKAQFQFIKGEASKARFCRQKRLQ